jgi:hypothetical protein
MLWIARKVLLFWEQITRLAVPYVGMDWARADSFRKLVGGVEEPEELEALRQRLLAGAARSFAVPTTEVAEVFVRCAAFRVYGFVESHAWAFAQYSFASAYLRHQFPAPYLAIWPHFRRGPPACGPPTLSRECMGTRPGEKCCSPSRRSLLPGQGTGSGCWLQHP